MGKLKLVVLYGGSSNERDVSFMTYKSVMESLNKEKYKIYDIEVPKDLNDHNWVYKLMEVKPDLVFIALHGGLGENGSLQGLLDCLNIPYVGTGVLGSALGMDKRVSKKLMRVACIPVPDDVFIKKNEDYTKYLKDINSIGYPVVVKPNTGGSSIGIVVAVDEGGLEKAIKNIQKMGDDILVEKYIEGREVTCGIIEANDGIEVMNVLDIGTTEGFYDYKARYEDDRSRIDFSTLPEYLQQMIKEIAKKAFNILRCKDYARLDMIVSEEQVFVLEMNTLPGLTSRSLIPHALEGGGKNLTEFLDELIFFSKKS